MTKSQPNQKYTVLLVGNYLPDEQRSMLRFAQQLKEGLLSVGVQCRVYHPPVIFGKIKAGTHGIGKWLGYIDKYLFAPFALLRTVRSIPGPVIVHICDHSNAHYTSALQRIPHLITCHDLLAVRSALGEFPQNQPAWMGRQQQAIIVRGLKKADQIVCVSEATADDTKRLIDAASPSIHIIANALDDAFIDATSGTHATNHSASTAIAQLPSEARYLLHVGSNSWYKNRPAVLNLFSQLAGDHPDLHCVVVGPEFTDQELITNGCAELKPRIHYAVGITDASLRQLYQQAKLLVFPSLIEGFGWPILEAQACGCPVLTLNRAPMNQLNARPELCIDGDLCSAQSLQAAVTQCRALLHHCPPATIEAIQAFAAQFTNKASAQAYKALYEAKLTSSTKP